MKIKMTDVAREAGVSAATVSRVLSGKDQVSPVLREKVLAAAAKLDYQPGRVARSLRLQSALTLGLVIENVEDPYFAAVATAVEDEASEHQYSTILCNTRGDLEKEQRYLRILYSERVAGVVLAPSGEDHNPMVERLLNAGIPIVCIARQIESPEVDTILPKNKEGAQEAVSHLLSLGHQRIGLIAGPKSFASGRERTDGYIAALKCANLEVDPKLMQFAKSTQDNGSDLINALLEATTDDPPSAIFISSWWLVPGILEALQSLNLRVPEDVALVTFSDMPYAGLLQPPLSVVRQPTYEIGRRAVSRLMELAEKPDQPVKTIRLNTTLVIRESSTADYRSIPSK
jgi:DNA-binding LacI/PurR family transcriptional regulator